jgi:peptide/nickel transport system substrate-binding protein
MKRFFIFIVVILILVSIIPLSGCSNTMTSSSSTTANTSPKYGGTLRFIRASLPGDAGGWPAGLWGSNAASPQLCLEGLLRMDNKGNITPWLAESYHLADDLKSITFDLRKGIKFHDGTDFNAEAAKWNLENCISARVVPNWASVDILGDYSIRVNFSQWSNIIWSNLSEDGYSWMVSPTAFQQHDKEWMANNPIGTGPFKFVSYQTGVSYKVTRNPDYWKKDDQGNRLPYLDGVELICISSEMTQSASLRAGEADVLEIDPGKLLSDLEALGFTAKISVGGTVFIVTDAGHIDSPYAKKGVREALEYAIDREAIAKAFSYGYWEAAIQLPGATSTAYNPDFNLGRKFDPEKARQLLAEAGYPDGFKTNLLLMTGPTDNSIPVLIQSNLSDVGIKAELIYSESIGDWMKKQNSIFSMINIQPVPEYPANICASISGTLGPQGMTNQNWPRTDEFVKLLTASLAAPKPDVKLMRAVTDYLVEEALVTPIAGSGKSYAMYSYLMDAGFLERSIATMWKPEQAWLNK